MDTKSPAWTRSGQALADVLDVLAEAERLLRNTNLPEPADIVDLPSAIDGLGQIWRGVRATLAGDRRAGERLAGTRDLVALLARARQTELDLERLEIARQRAVLRATQEALSRFHQVDTVADLIESSPSAVCALGFDRAIFSRIQDCLWIAESVWVQDDPQWAAQIQEAGHANPEPLRAPLYESEIVRWRRPITVSDGQQRPQVHRAISTTSKSRAYVAAPVMPHGDVIGFLHADRYFQKGPMTDADRDLLSLFASGFGYALDRAVLLDRLAGLRSNILQFTAGMGDLTETSAAAGAPPAVPFGAPATRDRHGFEGTLTRRELDVLRLMAAGDTNHRIASKLVISEGTVKSHVKHILRKLVAANRAEAVSIWLNSQRESVA